MDVIGDCELEKCVKIITTDSAADVLRGIVSYKKGWNKPSKTSKMIFVYSMSAALLISLA